MNASRLIQILLACATAAMIVAGVATSEMIRDKHDALERIQRYNLAHATSQSVLELSRLKFGLLRLERDATREAAAEARLRFEILFSRLSDYEARDFAEFAASDPARLESVATFRTSMASLDRMIGGMRGTLDVRRALDLLDPLEKKLILLAGHANDYGTRRAAEDRQDLVTLHDRFSILTFGLMVSSLALVGAVLWHNGMLHRAHRSLSDITLHWKRAAADLENAKAETEAANAELRNQNTLFNAALNNMSQGLCMFAGEDMVPIVANRQFNRMFRLGSAGDDEAGPDAVPPGLMTADLAAQIRNVLRSGRSLGFEQACSDGRIIAVSLCPMQTGGWVATFEDVTEQRLAQARIEHMARHDVLTDLPNRYALRERLNEALAEQRSTGGSVAIMCLDLDHFKEVNDTLGHPTGDALLCAAAQRLRHCVRESDMVARFGGDEFAVLLPLAEDRAVAEMLGARIVDELSRPFDLSGERVHITSSVGIAFSGPDADDADKLLKNADLALYAAKGEGRHGYRFFEVEMGERLSLRHAMERDIRTALADGQFEVFYQPVVALGSLKVTGMEALIRWDHPVRGPVSPGEFIPIAEDTGLISEIGRYVLRRACQDAMSWPAELSVAVNLSAAQFTQSDILEDVSSALARAGLSPARLVVEITESLLLNEDRATLEKLHRLKTLGVEIAMDDFGTGYSSLSYLRKYPFDRIKIDRAFLQTASEGEHGAAIIQTIVDLGRSLGMTTVAEGVETEADLQLLRNAGCLEGQGYLFSPAVPREQIPALLAFHERNFSKVA